MKAKQNPETDTTIDKLLGGRFEVEQPAKGYRIAVDTLLLAAAVPARSGQTVCELGCGVGGVMLALAARVPDCTVTGLELQPAMAALCTSNIERNGYAARLKVVQGDVASLPLSFKAAYDHVMMNPPFHDHKTHTLSANQAKRLAYAESDEADLAVWIAQAAQCLKDDGPLTLIHRADRLDEIVELAQRNFQHIAIKPIIAREDAAPKRILVQMKGVATQANAGEIEEGGQEISDPSPRKTMDLLDASPSFSILSRKGRGGPSMHKTGSCSVVTLPPFVLYGDDGRYNAGAEDVLRNAQPIRF